MAELIVEFVRGTSEDDARAVVEGAGGKVRRRMRGDDPEHLMLLVRGADALRPTLSAAGAVARVELNDDGYRPMGD